ncbi:Membrane protein involved in the export of O-antigen and teichoic acid [Actinomyces denticolens]|uniref:Membrane protein involved in the export of O-antigen and teichoic acid n=2 Tax=Actinomyces denticolens TaxID=52767 RepID=A0ABY1HXZ3_9ACTO|nr:Membrane protein involved in the export of O-antigen and teichoic acid [Actinomyces denticolens]
MARRWEALVARSPVLGAILTLMTGTAAAQLITLVLQIFIARVYSDVDKGLLGMYGSVTGFVITFAALRFDLAIVLPTSERAARVLTRLATRCIVLSSLMTSLTCIALARVLRDHYHHSGPLMWWLMGSGVTVFLVAQVTNLQYWLTRQGRFGAIARNRVLQSTAVAGLQLVFGLALHGGISALLLGTIVGQLLTYVGLRRRAPELSEPIGAGAPSLAEMASRYRRMPLLNGPNAVVDSLRNNGINLLIGAVSVAALGQFQLAWNILQVPVALIAGSVSQVFLKKLSDVEPGEMTPLVRYVLLRALLAATVPFALLYLLAPWLFPLVFGATWVDAGHCARALTPWLLLTVLSSPVSNIFVVTETQSRLLAFAIVYCAAPLAWLWLSPWPFMTTLTVLGALMALLLVGMIAMALAVARRFDRGLTPRAEERPVATGDEAGASAAGPADEAAGRGPAPA